MWNSNHHYSILQQGHINLKAESQGSNFFQECKVSQASNRAFRALVTHFDESERPTDPAQGFDHSIRRERRFRKRGSNYRIKAENALLPVYRKELRKVLLEYPQWMHAMKKDPTFKKVMET